MQYADKELEIKLQFLDEAQDYVTTLESSVMGLSSSGVDLQRINAALRSAHSIKGGAAMMGYPILSELAHRLEDSFKVLKVRRDVAIDGILEADLLGAVDCLNWVIAGEKQRSPVDQAWFETQALPLFNQLHQQLGDPQEEDASSILAMEDEQSSQDILRILFESEVEGCLQRLEAAIANHDPCLKEETEILAQELGGLGEMLQLAPFVQLCQSVEAEITTQPEQTRAIATAAVESWRRSQTMVLAGNLAELPDRLGAIARSMAASGVTGRAIVEPVDYLSTDPLTETGVGDGTEAWEGDRANVAGRAVESISQLTDIDTSFTETSVAEGIEPETGRTSEAVTAQTSAQVSGEVSGEVFGEISGDNPFSEDPCLANVATSGQTSGLSYLEVSSVEVSSAEVSSVEVSSAEVSSAEVSSAEVSSVEWSDTTPDFGSVSDASLLESEGSNLELAGAELTQGSDGLGEALGEDLSSHPNFQPELLQDWTDGQLDAETSDNWEQVEQELLSLPIDLDGLELQPLEVSATDPAGQEVGQEVEQEPDLRAPELTDASDLFLNRSLDQSNADPVNNFSGTLSTTDQLDHAMDQATIDQGSIDQGGFSGAIALDSGLDSGTGSRVENGGGDRLPNGNGFSGSFGSSFSVDSPDPSDSEPPLFATIPSTAPSAASANSWSSGAWANPANSSNPETFDTASSFTPPPEAPDILVRVSSKQLDQLNDLVGELIIERNAVDLHLKRLRTLVQTLNQRVQTLEQSNVELRDAYDQPTAFPLLPAAAQSPPTPQSPAPFDPLELDRYNKSHSLSQEVMETIVQIQEVTNDIDLSLDDSEQTARNLNKTAKQLQTKLTKVRMRPLSDVTDRFPRALRELALQHNKPVELTVNGGQLLVDRNILEALNEPLMHLIRNAFDHGIETRETRLLEGKPEIGQISIKAIQQNNRTVVVMQDDGAGIDLAKIRTKAQQMGLDTVLLDAASDDDLLSLIFEPGFSTSNQVTALSGRGVGMDIVRDRLKQVHGEIQVKTEPGRGTSFTISVPFTMSVTRVLLAESNRMLMAFPMDLIEEMLVLSADQLISTLGSQVFNWQGTMVQLVRLAQWLQFNCPRQVESLETAASVNVPSVLLMNLGGQRIGIEIDKSWGEQEVVIRQVEGGLRMPSGFNNCTILGDGRVVPLVNVPELLRWIASQERFAPPQRLESQRLESQRLDGMSAIASADTAHNANQPTILIVDDSINVRRLLALTLERAGYQVAQAKDGQDAIDKLSTGLAVQAVICDIEMPRLDGFGFLARFRSNTDYATIPVTMLTTRSGEKHRQLAMSLGATAYVSKPFNEQALLQTLEELIAA